MIFSSTIRRFPNLHSKRRLSQWDSANRLMIRPARSGITIPCTLGRFASFTLVLITPCPPTAHLARGKPLELPEVSQNMPPEQALSEDWPIMSLHVCFEGLYISPGGNLSAIDGLLGPSGALELVAYFDNLSLLFPASSRCFSN